MIMRKLAKQVRKNKQGGPRLEPTLSVYNPSRFLGSTSEKFALKVEEYMKQNPHGLLKVKGDKGQRVKRRHNLLPTKLFQLLMSMKYMRSLVDPGEAVGLLASQGYVLSSELWDTI